MTDIAQELEKLARLHETGALTDEEFARAKDAALGRKDARSESLADDVDSASLGNAANRYVNFQIAMTVVGLIVFIVVFVVVFLPRLNAFPRP
ncbi:MAG: SHOCT domain-containing protein [Candidatus Limnocylindria bacterium]